MQVEKKAAFFSEDNIFGDGKVMYKLEMLMYHTDTEFVSIIRIIDNHLFTVYKDFSRIRVV